MHFKKSVLKNHLLYSIITLMAIAMLFPITAYGICTSLCTNMGSC